MIWTVAFWEKWDFLITKLFCFPSTFFTEISLLACTHSWFVMTHKAELVLNAELFLLPRYATDLILFERFREFSDKPCDDSCFCQALCQLISVFSVIKNHLFISSQFFQLLQISNKVITSKFRRIDKQTIFLFYLLFHSMHFLYVNWFL